MDKLRRLRAYIEIYYATATQHQTARAAREWMEADVPPEAAGAWASLGYLPGEAAPLIAAGVTPAMAAEMEDLAVDPE
jgi:hypothetical protein